MQWIQTYHTQNFTDIVTQTYPLEQFLNSRTLTNKLGLQSLQYGSKLVNSSKEDQFLASYVTIPIETFFFNVVKTLNLH